MPKVLAAIGCTAAPLKALQTKGLLRQEVRRVDTAAAVAAGAATEMHLELNDDQRQALRTILDTLEAGRHETILIHGVTGSGKTEVYIQAIQEVLHYGRQAIVVLVPEISLTPQTEQRFRSRFGSVAVLHSHQSDSERHRHWGADRQGRSAGRRRCAYDAVFAPTPNLGLIILDEEHETSSKQSTAPRYHARDVAIQRAQAECVPLVLGSATPSLESWHNGHVCGRRRHAAAVSFDFDAQSGIRSPPAPGRYDRSAQ